MDAWIEAELVKRHMRAGGWSSPVEQLGPVVLVIFQACFWALEDPGRLVEQGQFASWVTSTCPRILDEWIDFCPSWAWACFMGGIRI